MSGWYPDSPIDLAFAEHERITRPDRQRVTDLLADVERLKTAHQLQYEECMRQVAEVAALKALVLDLRPRCRYVDRKEAEAVKARIATALGEPPRPSPGEMK